MGGPWAIYQLHPILLAQSLEIIAADLFQHTQGSYKTWAGLLLPVSAELPSLGSLQLKVHLFTYF